MDGIEYLGYAVLGSMGLLIGCLVLVSIVRQFMYICGPNEVLVFSGGKRTVNGQKVGYRVVYGGRAFAIPFLEEVKRMDLTTMEVVVHTRNAFCKGGIRLNVDAVANVKISDDPRIIGNAIERFLGQDKQDIAEVAKATLEGHLRAVLANLTPEQVNEDRLSFAASLADEAEADLNKLGIHLDTFNIHSVADVKDSAYLTEIGRKSIAEVNKQADIAEAQCSRDATEVESGARSRADVAAEQAETEIRTKANELRKQRADFEAEAKSAEEQAEAARETARAVAEQQLQQVRAELEGKRLQAEVVVKAEADAAARQFQARGEAAPIAERGKAMAASVEMVRQAWIAAGDGAKPIFMIQQLDSILRQVVERVEGIRVDNVSLVDRGDGSSIPAYVSSFPATVNAVLKQLDDVTGIDVIGTLGNPERATNGHGDGATALLSRKEV